MICSSPSTALSESTPAFFQHSTGSAFHKGVTGNEKEDTESDRIAERVIMPRKSPSNSKYVQDPDSGDSSSVFEDPGFAGGVYQGPWAGAASQPGGQFQYGAPQGAGDPPAADASIATLADYLVDGYWEWSGYGGTAPRDWADPTNISVNTQDLTAAERTIALQALGLWDDVCDITFTFTSGAADITFLNDGTKAATSYSVSSGNLSNSTVKIGSNWSGGAATGNYSYFFQTYVHEIGHALGLGHQGPYNGSATYGIDNIFDNDTWRWSVMSYNDQDDPGDGDTFDYVLTPQMADIYAVQSIYGAQATRTGNTTYGFNSTAGSFYDFDSYTGTPAFTFYDTGGTDTFDASGYADDQVIDLTPGKWSSVGGETNNIGIYLTTTIENARGGSGDDTITGNAADNTLIGNAGDDTLKGVGGEDILLGLDGNDTLLGGDGDDTLKGAGGDDSLLGGDGVDTLIGDDGNDTLNGGLGADDMDGGLGDDLYIVDNAGDVAGEVAGGVDTVESSITHTLSANLENLTLTGAGAINGAGNAKANVINGNAANNVLSGLGGNDTLAGDDGNDTLNGGSGADDMNGGLGNDLYIVDNAGDVAGEVAGGIDTVESSVTHTLSINLENLTLTGAAAINGTGNTKANVINGNAANNVLSGLGGNDTLVGGDGNDTLIGGSGADDMNGGLGNDLYVVDDAGDVAGEVAGGVDTVESSVTHTLSTNLENLTLTGAAAINGTGNAKANIISGNGADNVLDGGAGIDTASYAGAGGAITVALVTGAQDTGGAGFDTLIAIENLTGSSFDDSLTGNSSVNVLSGGVGNDKLEAGDGDDTLLGGNGKDKLLGGGGADLLVAGFGRDTMTGGSSADIFDFDAVAETGVTKKTRDQITDFTQGSDLIDLSTIDADALAVGNQAFAFIGAAAFSGVAGELRSEAGARTIVMGDINGDGAVDFQIQLTGNVVLTAANFAL